MYKVSVIIPSYGRPIDLVSAIDSVLSQTYKNIEIIVVDDNSNKKLHEETFAILKKYFILPNFKYVHDGVNRGGALSRNEGIKVSTGEYITFLDDDDIYLANKVEVQLQYMVNNNFDVCVCDMFFQRNKKLLNVSNCYARVSDSSEFVLNGNSYTPMIMCKRDSLLGISGFADSPKYQDHILMLKFFIEGLKIGHLKEKLFIHNDHRGERITFTNRSVLAYRIRQKYEKLLVVDFSDIDKKKYQFNSLLIESKIERANDHYLNCLASLYKAFRKITSPKDIFKIVKTFIRVNLFPKKSI